MARRKPANGMIITLLWLSYLLQNVNVLAFISRCRPLYMVSGDNNQMDPIDKTILSVSTSTSSSSPQAPIRKNNVFEVEKKSFRRKGRPNKKKKIAAPLVDSTLLRFLSAQKSQLAAQEDMMVVGNDNNNINDDSNNSNKKNTNSDRNAINNNNNNTTTSTSTTTISLNIRNMSSLDSNIASIMETDNALNETELIQSMTDNLNDNVPLVDDDDNHNENVATNDSVQKTSSSSSSSPLSTTQVSDTTADSISWFTQYNAHNVAQKLITLGSSTKDAQIAGNAVQNYSLARTTRQRVRKFLSERDSIWSAAREGAADSSSITKNSNNDDDDENNHDIETPMFQSDVVSFLTATESQQKYNINSVIDVLTGAGLTGTDIAAIFTHTPSVTMMNAKNCNDDDEEEDVASPQQGDSLEATLNRAYFGVLCSTIKLRKYDARKILRTCPGLLTKWGSTSSEEVISILVNLGVAPSSLCRNKAALPILLSRSPAALFRLVAFLSSDAVRMPVNRIGPLFRQSECANLLDFVAPLKKNQSASFGDEPDDDSLVTGEENGIETEITRRYKAMFRTAKYLRRVVGISDLGRSIAAYANILTLDIEGQISPCIEFLSEEVGIYEEEIPRVLELYPQLVGANIEKMKENIEYLVSLEVAEEDLSSIFRAFPALLTLEKSKMEEVVNFLQDVGVSNIGRFVTRLPPVLGYSVKDDLIPKWSYLTKIRNYASFEISRFPAFFSYPLDRVIRNRFDYLIQIGQLPVQLLPVDEVLRYGDKDFAILVARDDNENQYNSFVNERKKSQLKSSRKISQPRKKETSEASFKREI